MASWDAGHVLSLARPLTESGSVFTLREMAYRTRVSPELLRQFKEASQGLDPRRAGETIILAVLDHFQAEITVLDRDGDGELFRVGMGYPSHGINGVQIHPLYVQWGTWQLKAHRDAIAFLTDEDFNMYLGTLLQALELGRFRAGFE
jgi:hypothetical protein